MNRFLLLAAAGVLALVLHGETASAQKRGGPVRGSQAGRYAYGRSHALPRGLHGRTLPGHYSRFSRFRYDARYRCRFCLAGGTWYYWYAPYQYYLPVEVIETYPPMVVTPPAAVMPLEAVPPVTPAVGDPD